MASASRGWPGATLTTSLYASHRQKKPLLRGLARFQRNDGSPDARSNRATKRSRIFASDVKRLSVATPTVVRGTCHGRFQDWRTPHIAAASSFFQSASDVHKRAPRLSSSRACLLFLVFVTSAMHSFLSYLFLALFLPRFHLVRFLSLPLWCVDRRSVLRTELRLSESANETDPSASTVNVTRSM